MATSAKLATRPTLNSLLFATVIAIGGLLVATGMFVLPALPHFQLDVVLSEDELRDDETRERTLMILEKVNRNRPKEGAILAVPGFALIFIGAIGIYFRPSGDRCAS